MLDLDARPGRSAHRLYAHVVWPTLGRIPLVSPEARDVVERHLISLARRLDAEPVCVRAFADRAHLLIRFKPGHSLAGLVGRLKDGSETALQASGHSVRWGHAYAAATIGGDEVRRAMRRIVRIGDARPARSRRARIGHTPGHRASPGPPEATRTDVDASGPAR